MKLTESDENKLATIHPDLARVVRRAAQLTPQPFRVLEGVRTMERQLQLIARGASKTTNSRHLPGEDGLARAVDIAPMDNGTVSWHWPLYNKLAVIVKRAAALENITVEWGGDWKTFRDGPHWQLPHNLYP